MEPLAGGLRGEPVMVKSEDLHAEISTWTKQGAYPKTMVKKPLNEKTAATREMRTDPIPELTGAKIRSSTKMIVGHPTQINKKLVQARGPGNKRECNRNCEYSKNEIKMSPKHNKSESSKKKK